MCFNTCTRTAKPTQRTPSLLHPVKPKVPDFRPIRARHSLPANNPLNNARPGGREKGPEPEEPITQARARIPPGKLARAALSREAPFSVNHQG